MTRLSVAQARGLGYAPAKESKYKSQKAVVDGHTFDSRKEARKYQELLLEKRAGIVLKIELQPEFLLQEGFRDPRTMKWIRPIVYRADFRVIYRDGRVEVIDTKGYKTPEYLIKKKMLLFKYPKINFVEE